MHVTRGSFHMVLMSFGEEEKKTFDLGTFLLGKVNSSDSLTASHVLGHLLLLEWQWHQCSME